MAIKKKKEENQPTLNDYKVLLEPIVTEKTAGIGGDNYSGIAFKVDRKATKDEIKAAIERVFSVEVAKVRTCNYLGKVKRSGRSTGRRSSYKKAIISLKPGSEIDIFEGI